MRHRTALPIRRLSLIAATLLLWGCTEATQPSPVASAPSARAGGGGNDGTALGFDGTVTASTDWPKVATTRIDNVAYDVMVRFDGPKASNTYQTIVYNGHGGLSGWGILVLGSSDGYPEGTLAILSGGIDVRPTNLTLTPGVWQHVQAERRDGNITVSIDDRTFDMGYLYVQPIGDGRAVEERLSVGGDGLYYAPQGGFNGAIDKLRIRDLASDAWIERFNFNEGTGTTTVGSNGTVVNLGGAHWTSRGNSDN